VPTLVASETGAKIPDWLRLAIAAVSGAALSLSFTGLYLGIYSWICVAALLLAVLGASGRVAFACGFFHALLFVVTSVPWIATVLSVHGGLPIAGGWGGLLLTRAACGGVQCAARLGGSVEKNGVKATRGDRGNGDGRSGGRNAGWASAGAAGTGAAFCARRAAQFSRGTSISVGLVCEECAAARRSLKNEPRPKRGATRLVGLAGSTRAVF